MTEYTGLVMIALIHDGLPVGSHIVGMRIYDIESGNAMDTSLKSVENNLKSGKTICNLKINNQGKVEANGNDSLSCYSSLDFRTRKICSAHKYIIAYKNNCVFRIDWNGTFNRLDMLDLVAMVKEGTIANISYAKEIVNTLILGAGSSWYTPVREVPNGFSPEVGGCVKVGTANYEGVKKLKLMEELRYKGMAGKYTGIDRYPSNNFIILFIGGKKQFILYDEMDDPNQVIFSSLIPVETSSKKDKKYNNINAKDIVYMDRRLSVTSNEIANIPGILKKKIENADNTWAKRHGTCIDTVGILLISRRPSIENGFTVILWYERYRSIEVINLKVESSLFESLNWSINPFQLEQQAEGIVKEIDRKFNMPIRRKPEDCKIEDLIYMDRRGVYLRSSSLNIGKKSEQEECIKSIKLLPIVVISDRSLANHRKIGSNYIYNCSLNEATYNVITEMSPDNIREAINGKVMMGGFDAQLTFYSTRQLSYKTNELGVTYQNIPGNAYPCGGGNSVIYLYSPEIADVRAKLPGERSGEDCGLRYLGYIGYERVFEDSSIYYKINPELLKLYRKAITGSYVDVSKGILVVFVGEYKIIYDLEEIKGSIEKAKEVRDKVEKAQNMHSLLGLDNVDGAGYITLRDATKVNSYYANRPLVLMTKGVSGIKTTGESFNLSALYTNQNLKLDIPGKLILQNIKLGHGAEATLGRLMSSGQVRLVHAEYDKGFKLSSSQYYSLLSYIVKGTVNIDRSVIRCKNESIMSKNYIVNCVYYNSELAYSFVKDLQEQSNGISGVYRNLGFRQLFRGKSDLVIKAILPEKKLADCIHNDLVSGTNESATLVGYSCMLAVAAAILGGGEDDIIERLKCVVGKEKRLRLMNFNIIEYYQRIK